MAVLKAIVSLYRAGEEKPIERYKTRVKVTEENKLFSPFQKSIIENLNTVDEYIKATVINVKETNNLKEDSTTNGPQGTVSQKTQTSIELLLNGVKSLMSKDTNVNPNYKDTVTIDWKTLVTTIVENLHAVSHFKHETFDALQYATDFGSISKESLKRITKGGEILYTSIFILSSATDWNVVQGCKLDDSRHFLLMSFLKGRNRL